MNRIKLLIAPESTTAQQQLHQQQQQLFDKKLSHRIKRFSSERNLFFANIYSNNGGHVHTPPPPLPTAVSHISLAAVDKPMSKLEKTKSFCRSGLKKCKSLKELYQQRNAKTDDAKAVDPKSFQHLDEFERNYLFSAGKRDLVRELRKNFEKQLPVTTAGIPAAEKATYRKCDFSEQADEPDALAASKRRPLNACHSFSVTSNAEQCLNKFGPNMPSNTSEPPSWTQSAMNLSTLTTTDESSDSASSDQDSGGGGGRTPPTNGTDLRCAAVLLKNMRNSSHLRATDGDTMSMCELSLYPVYMQNINDPNLLAGRQPSDRDSGISINNITAPNASASAATIGLKKYNSVNQINLELLKSELNDFADDSDGVCDSRATALGLWGTAPAHRQQRHRGSGSAAPPPPRLYHHRSASSLVSSVRRKVGALNSSEWW